MPEHGGIWPRGAGARFRARPLLISRRAARLNMSKVLQAQRTPSSRLAALNGRHADAHAAKHLGESREIVRHFQSPPFLQHRVSVATAYRMPAANMLADEISAERAKLCLRKIIARCNAAA